MNDAALFGALYVLTASMAGAGFAAAHFYRREGRKPMAVYEVTRTDSVSPGEFVSALVVASGTAQARKAVAHMTGVTPKNVRAERYETVNVGVSVLAAYFDESPTLDDALSDEPAWGDSEFIGRTNSA